MSHEILSRAGFFYKVYCYSAKGFFISLMMYFTAVNSLFGLEASKEAVIKYEFLKHEEVVHNSDPAIRHFSNDDVGHSKIFLSSNNFPLNKKITCSLKRPLGKIAYRKIAEFDVDKEGRFIINDQVSDHRYFCCVSSKGFLPGERVFIRLCSSDGTFRKVVNFIPNQMKVSNDSKTAFVVAELVEFPPAFYKLTFHGFTDGEKIDLVSISNSERLTKSFEISERLNFMTSPDVEGEKAGVGKIIFNRKSGESFTLNLPWGEELYEYLLQVKDKVYSPNTISKK